MDFKKIELTWSMGKRRKLYLPRVLVTPWNGSTLVSMRTLRHILERISFRQYKTHRFNKYLHLRLAIAFLLRPIGGIVFGIIGDKYGRKVVLTTTIILMALSTLTIGVLPNYDMIGLWAPRSYCSLEYYNDFLLVVNIGAMTYIRNFTR